jgi:hypothetical protein
MDFGDAIRTLKEGKRVAREGWNGKGQWLKLATSSMVGQSTLLPFIYICTVQGEIVPWLASQTDMLAEDWMVVE